MAEVNDLFMRSLRNSTSKRPVVAVQLGLAVTLSKQQTASWLTGRHSASGENTTLASPKTDQMPPDLLANLTPRHQSNDDEGRCSSRISTGSSTTAKKASNWMKKSPSTPTVPSAPSVPTAPSAPTVLTAPSAPTVLTAPSVPTAPSVLTVPSAPSAPVVKEYQVQEKSGRFRKNSAAVLLNQQVRVVPTWFPPANISRLKRQDSFHGETAASRLLGAKQRAFRMECRREASVPAENDSTSCAQTIMEESGITTAATSAGAKKYSKPPKPDMALPPPICPRHAKHHSISPLSIPKTPTSSVLEQTETSGGSVSAVVKKSVQIEKKPKNVFKFGTLPRSFKVSGTGRSSPALFRPLGSPTLVEPPKSAPPLVRRTGGGAARKSRNRNSWHVTVPVLRPDVALPEDKIWFDPLSVPSAQQKLCSCGDTRKHVHLVKFASDLTLMDTRYFLGEKSDGETANQPINQSFNQLTNESSNQAINQTCSQLTTESPNQPINQSPELETASDELMSDFETDWENNSDCPDDEWGTIAASDSHEEEVKPEEPDVAEILDEALSSAHREIDAISIHDKSMLRKLLDMSDQIRHWNGSRKHRIRSVDSSPVVSQLNLFSVGNKSLGNFPPLLRTSIKSIPEELHLPARTYSMENLHQSKGQVPDNASLALRFAKDTISDISASHLRTNMHLSYSDLLKNSSKFWQQPSQPGSFDAAPEISSNMCVLREASLSLLL